MLINSKSYIGPGIKDTVCPLCHTYKIEISTNSGFHAGHIVSAKYVIEDKLNIFHVYPCCAACNSECSDLCMFDYLFCRQRIHALKRLITSIYKVFMEENGHMLTPEHCLIWMVLEKLYGQKRYPAGGFIVNTKAIYEIARGEQLALLSEELTRQTEKLVKLSKEYQLVASAEIKPFLL